MRFTIVLVSGLLLSLAFPPAQAATQVPTSDGRGAVTVDIGSSATTDSPATIASDGIATPVPHAGAGVITTTTVTPSARRAGTLLAPLVASTPSLTVTSSCDASSNATITIADAGADMTVPFTWRLSLNGTPLASNTFQLNVAQSLSIHTAGLFGTLTTDVLDASNAVVASGSAFCPAPAPPAFTISASCAVDANGTITIANVRSDMTVPFTWRLSLNATPIASNTFKLNAAQSLSIHTAGLFGTLTTDVLDPSGAVVASAPMLCQTAPATGTPAFNVVSSCAADSSGTITITDAGASMTSSFTWRLSLNGTPIASNTFQLGASQSTSIHTSGLFGTLTTDVLDGSNAVVASGSAFCPAPPPPALTIGASCAADATGTIAIANVGTDMTVPFTWRLSDNGTPIASNTFKLNAAQSTTIHTSGIFGTLALDILDASSAVVASASMLCVSQGVLVPNVVGLTLAAATSALTSAGLVVGTVTTANSSTVPAGSIISESPSAGASVAAGSAVNLVVSNGVLVGDVNGDGVVNCTDLAIVKASFGKRMGQVGFDPRADVNHDGVVNILDLSIVAHALPVGTVCS